MIGTGLFLSDEAMDLANLEAIDVYLKETNAIDTANDNKGLFFTKDQIEAAKHNEKSLEINSKTAYTITPAYDEKGRPNFKDSAGELIAGIYSGLENEVYHSLDAISSSQIKKYAKSPAHFKRAYIDKINRKRTLKSTERTLDAGTYAHELVLEPEGFNDRYFRLLNAAEHENSIHLLEDLKAKCAEMGLAVSGSKATLIERIKTQDPTVLIFEVQQEEHILKNAGKKAVEKAKEFMKKSTGRPSLIDSLREDCVTPYLIKTPVDPIVWDDAHRACETVRNHEWADSILQDGHPELSVIAQCPETGLMLKVRFDWLTNAGLPADLKTTRSCNPLMAAYQFADLGYDLQAVFYTHVGRLAGIPCPPHVFPFVAVEYLDADICEVFELGDDDWEIATNNYYKHISNLAHSLVHDEWPGYTQRNGSTLLHLPKRGRA